MAGKKITYSIGFQLDKAGLNEIQQALHNLSLDAKMPGQEANAGLQEAAETGRKLSEILDKCYNSNLGEVNMAKFNEEIQKANISANSMRTSLFKGGSSGATAFTKLSAAISTSKVQIKESNKMLDDMAKTMSNTVKWGVASSVFRTITDSIQQAYSYSIKLDKSLNDIRIVTGQSADQMAKFAEKANTAAKQMGANTLDYTSAALIYYQQGLSDQEAQARADVTVKTANVTGQTGAEVSEQLTAVWNGYKVTSEEAEKYVDKLAAVAASTASDLEELSKGMSKVASAANTAGVDVDQLNGMLSTIVSVTREAPESAGTALKTIFARMGDLKIDGGADEFGVKLGDVSGQLASMGVNILDENSNLRDMGEVIEEVGSKWQGWTRSQKEAAAVALAGKRQYTDLMALFENWDMYESAVQTSKDSLGTLDKQNEIYLESTTAKLQTLKATWQDLYAGLINKNEIDFGIEAITNLVQVFDNFIDSFGGGSKALLGFGAIFSNVFNKQISNALIQARENKRRLEVNKNNLEMKDKMTDSVDYSEFQGEDGFRTRKAIEEDMEEGSSAKIFTRKTKTDNGIKEEQVVLEAETFQARAALEIEEKRLGVSKQIESVRDGMSQKEYNRLMDVEKEYLKEVEIEELAKAENEDIAKQLEHLGIKKDLLDGSKNNYEEITASIGEQNEALNEQLTIAQSLTEKQEEIRNLKKDPSNKADLGYNEWVGIKKDYFQDKENLFKEAFNDDLQGKSVEELNEVKTLLEKIKNENKDLSAGTLKIIEAREQEITLISKQQQVLEGLDAIYDGLNEDEKKIVDEIKEQIKQGELNNEAQEQLVNIYEQQKDKLKDIQELKQKHEQNSDIQVGSKTKQKKATDDMDGSIDTAKKNLEISNTIQGFTSLISGVSMAYMSLSSIIQTLNDENASLGDKIVQIAMTSSMAIGQLVSAYNSFKEVSSVLPKAINSIGDSLFRSNEETLKDIQNKAVQTYMTELETEAEKRNKKAKGENASETLKNAGAQGVDTGSKSLGTIVTEKLTLATNKLNKAIMANPYVLVLGGVVALTAGLAYLLKVAVDLQKVSKDNDAEKRAEEIKSTGEAANSAIEQIQNLKTAWEQLTEDRTKLGDLKEGTLEWYEALNKVNTEVRDLANNFPELQNKIKMDENGALYFEPEDIEDAIKNKQIAIGIDTYINTTDQNKENNENEKKNKKDNTDILDGIDKLDERFTSDYSEEKFKKGVTKNNFGELFRESLLENLVQKDGEIATMSGGVFQDKDLENQASKMVENLKKVVFDDKGLFDEEALKNEMQKLKEYNTFAENSDKKYEKQNERAVKSLLSTFNESFQEVSDTAKNYVIGQIKDEITEEKVNEKRQDIVNKEEYDTKEERIKAYAEANGLSKDDIDYDDDNLDETATKWLALKDILNGLNSTIDTNISNFDSFKEKFASIGETVGSSLVTDVLAQTLAEKEDGKQAKFDFSNYSAEELNDLTKVDKQSLISADYEEFGYKNANAFVQAWERAIMDAGREKKADSEAKEAENLQKDEEAKETTGSKYNSDRFNSEYKVEQDSDIDEKHLEKTEEFIKKSKEISETIKNNADEVKKLAIAQDRYDIALDKCEKNYSTWKKALKEGNEREKVETIGELKDAYGDLLDIPTDALSDGFAENTENLELFKKALDGSDEAYKQLQENAAKDILISANLDDESINTVMADTKAILAENSQDIDDLEIGAKLDDSINEQLSDLVNKCQMTAKQAQAYLTSMGIDATVTEDTSTKQTTQEFTDLIPDIKYENVNLPNVAVDGLGQNAQTTTVPKIEYEARKSNTPVETSEASAFALKVTDAKKGSGGEIKRKQTSHKSPSKGGGGGKGGKGGGGSSKKAAKKSEDKKDRYHKVNTKLSVTGKALEKVRKEQEKLNGKDLVDNINKQIELIEKQIKLQKEKIKLQKKEISEERGKLKKRFKDIKFDKDGTISNYNEMWDKNFAEQEKARKKYNASSKSEKDEQEWEDAQKRYNKNKELLENYDELVADKLPELEAELQEEIDSQYQLKIDQLDATIDLTINTHEAERELNEFLREMRQGLSDEVTPMSRKDYRTNKNSYINQIEQQKTQAELIQKEVEKFQKNPNYVSAIFGKDANAAKEALEKAQQGLMDSSKSYLDFLKDRVNEYWDALDKVIEAHQEKIESYDRANDRTSTRIDIYRNLTGKENSREIQGLNQISRQNSLEGIQARKELVSSLQKELAQYKEGSEEWIKINKKLIEANDDLENSIAELVASYREDFNNQVDLLTEELEEALAGQEGGLTAMAEQWELINKQAEMYVDNVNKSYELGKLERQIQKDIDASNNPKVKKALKAFQDKELQNLKDKENITQRDLDRLQKEYEVEKARLELEESKNNKSQMMLSRDSQGNYVYTYVEDEKDRAAKEEEYENKKNELYNSNKSALKEDSDELTRLVQEYVAKKAQMEKEGKDTKELDEQYGKMIKAAAEKAKTSAEAYKQSLIDMGQDPEQDSLYQGFMNNGGARLADMVMNGDFTKVMQDYSNKVKTAEQIMQEQMIDSLSEIDDELAEQLEKTKSIDDKLKTIEKYLKKGIKVDNKTKTQNNKNISKANDNKNTAKDNKDNAEKDWESFSSSDIVDSITSMSNTLKKSNEETIEAQMKMTDGVLQKGDFPLLTKSQKLYTDSTGKETQKSTTSSGHYYIARTANGMFGISDSKDGKIIGWAKKEWFKKGSFDTGGYTGEWGSDGKLAVLHEKELVLNQSDTENMLKIIAAVRDTAAMFQGAQALTLDGMVNNNTAALDNMSSQPLDQNVQIEAHFPNVTSQSEIEAALNNLVNTATQRALINK